MVDVPIQGQEIPLPIREWLGEIRELRVPQQGCTSRLAVLEAERGTFVLKHAAQPLFAQWLVQEHQVLQWLVATTMPAPAPCAFVDDRAGADPTGVWLLMDFLPGDTLTTVLSSVPPGTRVPLLRGYGEILAVIHATPPPPGMPVCTAEEWLDATLAVAAYHLRDFAEYYDDPELPGLLVRLQVERPAAGRATLIHGDFTTDNVLVADGRVTGIIDWSGGGLGDPRYDLALAFDVEPETPLTEGEIAAFFEGYGNSPLDEAVEAYFLDLYEFF